MEIDNILVNQIDSNQHDDIDIELYSTQFLNFSDIYLYYNNDEFLDLLYNSINEGRCEIETNLNDFNQDDLIHEYRYNRLSKISKFIISIDCDDKYLIISNSNERLNTYSYLTSHIFDIIIKCFNEQLKVEDDEENNDQIDLSELITFISKIHIVDDKLMTNVQLKNDEIVFFDNESFYDTNSNQIEINNMNGHQKDYGQFLVNSDEIEDQSQFNITDQNSSNASEETLNDAGYNNEDQLELLKERLSDYEFEQIEILIQLLNQDLTYENVLSHAVDLNYV